MLFNILALVHHTQNLEALPVRDLLSPATNPRDELCRAHADALMQDSVASHARQLEGAPQALS